MGLREDAIASTLCWTKRFTIRPWRFEELVTRIDSIESTYARAITRWTRRTPLWRQRPHVGGQRVGEEPVFPADVDPWNVDERQLSKESWHVASCFSCDGAKKIDCTTCVGSSRVRCTDCRGSGRVMSSSRKSTRMVNCRRCQGSGQMKCQLCRNGRVPCPECDAKGKIERWIEIETQPHSHVGIWPSGAHVEAHPAIATDSDEADQWSGARLVDRIETEGFLGDALGSPVTEALNWSSARVLVEPRMDARLDRTTYQSIRCYRARVTKVAFAFTGRTGHVQLFGRDAAPTSDFDAAPFTAYRKWISVTAVLAAATAGIGSILYVARDGFYAETVGAFLLALLVLGLGAILYTAAWRRRVGVNATRGIVGVTGIGLMAAGAVAAASLFFMTRPSLQDASDAIEIGDLALAERHLAALDRSGSETDDVWVAYYSTAAEQATFSDAALLDLLPASNERLGEHPEISDRRRDARVRLFDAAVDARDFGRAAEHLEALQGEPGGLLTDVDDHVATQLIEAADTILDHGDPAEAERALAVAWDDFHEDRAYAAMAEKVILSRAVAAPQLDEKVATLRRAADLDVSGAANEQLAALYEIEKAKLDEAEQVDTADDRVGGLTKLIARYTDLRNLFPERGAEIDERLKPLVDEKDRLFAKQRAVEELQAAAAERKHQAALRKEERRRKRAAVTSSSAASRSCCKYCSTGIPCGNTCISANKTCHKGPGCAC